MLTQKLAEETAHTIAFDVIPVIHMRDGKTIDFTGKDPEESAILDDWEPIRTAQFWIDKGASWIHIVDVDALFQRASTINWDLITQICRLPVRVQLLGGHLDMGDIRRAFQANVSRVILDGTQKNISQLASSAVSTYDTDAIGAMFTTKAVGKVGAIDAADDWPEAWAGAGGEEVVSRALQLYHLGIGTGIHTTVNDNGEMSGCDLRITRELASLSGINFQVGGEIYDLDDVTSCYNCKGVAGVLIGRALYNGNIHLKHALHTTRRRIAFETGLPSWKLEQDSVKARLRYRLGLSNLSQHLPERLLHVLDAGGGNGQDALALAGGGHTVELVDESTAMISDFEQANDLNPIATRIRTHQCALRDIPERFENNEFDLILCHNVIQYVADWQDQLAKALIPLKPDGLLSLITRNQQALPYLLDLDAIDIDQLGDLAKSMTTYSKSIDSEIALHTPTELIDWLADNDFDLIHQYGILTLNHYASTVNSPENESLISKLEHVESSLGAVSPHRDIARYVQLVARKR